jgi:hypothetical protein
MKAAYIERHGGLDELKYGDAPDPVAKRGEVVVVDFEVGENLDWWEKSERRARLRAILKERDGVDADDVALSHPGDGAAVGSFRGKMDGGRHLAGGARHASVGDKRHAVPAILQHVPSKALGPSERIERMVFTRGRRRPVEPLQHADIA